MVIQSLITKLLVLIITFCAIWGRENPKNATATILAECSTLTKELFSQMTIAKEVVKMAIFNTK